MNRQIILLTVIAAFTIVCIRTVAAQTPPNDPVSFSFDGGIAYQSEADLKDSEGSFSVNRWFVSGGVTYAWNFRNSIGLFAGGGASKYDFDDLTDIGGSAPWEEIQDTRLTLVGRFGFGSNG